MSLHSYINERFVKNKTAAQPFRAIVLKKPGQFQRILVISNMPEEGVLNKVRQDFKNAEVNSLTQRNKKDDQSTTFHYTVHPTDFNLTGGLKNDKLTKLLQTTFDMVIDLSENSTYLNYLISRIKSTLVIGRLEQSENSFHDLFFDPGNNPTDFIQTIVNQLNQLTSNEKQQI